MIQFNPTNINISNPTYFVLTPEKDTIAQTNRNMLNPIHLTENLDSRLSSCYFLDLRNSTYLIRAISENRADKNSGDKIRHQLSFMLKIHRKLHQLVADAGTDKFYYNDTGDGHVCLLWNETHAWTALQTACTMASYLKTELKEYNEGLLAEWSEELNVELSLDFGMGLHSGGSMVYHDENINRNFAYGIVINSAARVEAFSKHFKGLNILFTKYFLQILEDQFELLDEASKKGDWDHYRDKIKRVTGFRVEIKDGKSEGHSLYTIEDENWDFFSTIIK